MSTLRTERCTLHGSSGRCRGRVLWVWSEVSRRAIPIQPDPVEPGTNGALVLIGNKVFSLPMAVQRLRDMFGGDDVDAYTRAHEEYGWHLPHRIECEARAGRQSE